MSNKQDYQRYLNWLDTRGRRMDPIAADLRGCPPLLARILDHGMIVAGVCMGRDRIQDFDGVEFGVLSRTYVPPESLTNAMPGIKHIVLPYPCEAGTPVLTIITGTGAGADALVSCGRWLQAEYLSYMLPQHMEHNHLIALRPVAGTNTTQLAVIKEQKP